MSEPAVNGQEPDDRETPDQETQRLAVPGQPAPANGQPADALRVEHIAKRYGAVTALVDLLGAKHVDVRRRAAEAPIAERSE